MSNSKTNKPDAFTRITNQIVADLQKGVKSWTRPWAGGGHNSHITMPRRHSGETYQGINILTLWVSSIEQGFSSSTWMTYKQALDLGGQVRKGETGSPVVYASTFTKNEDQNNPESKDIEIPFMKGYTVFNTDQIDDLPDQFYDKPTAPDYPVNRIDHAERFFRNTGAKIVNGGNQAFYTKGPDYIKMPHIEVFSDSEDYYATIAHEITHWTRHPDRLDRDFGQKRFGDEGYAKEELVAELGAAFICAHLGIKLEDREDHSAYIASWLLALENDKRYIFHAAADAQRAVNFIMGLQNLEKEAA